MRQLERYVMGEVLRVFGALIVISTLVFGFVGVFELSQRMDLGIWQILQIMPYVIPNLMPYTIPATLLLTVCVVYGRMAGDCEIIAARAAGVHIMHLMWPSFFVAGVLSVGTLILTDQVIPWAFSNIERIAALAMEDIFLDKLRAENWINKKDYGITISVTGVRDRTLINPTIRYAPRGGKAVTTQASSANLEFDLRNKMVWLTLKGMHGNLAGSNQTIYSRKMRIPFAIPTPAGGAGARLFRTRELLSALNAQEEKLKSRKQQEAVDAAFALSRGDFESMLSTNFQSHGWAMSIAVQEVRNLRTEYFNRFSMAVSCFFVVLLGTPFAILMAKKQFLTTFLFCFLPILTVYYPVAMMTQNLSKAGQLDPIYAAWIANGVLFVAALYYIRRVLKN